MLETNLTIKQIYSGNANSGIVHICWNLKFEIFPFQRRCSLVMRSDELHVSVLWCLYSNNQSLRPPYKSKFSKITLNIKFFEGCHVAQSGQNYASCKKVLSDKIDVPQRRRINQVKGKRRRTPLAVCTTLDSVTLPWSCFALGVLLDQSGYWEHQTLPPYFRIVDSVKTGDPKHVLSDLQIHAFNTDLEKAMNF